MKPRLSPAFRAGAALAVFAGLGFVLACGLVHGPLGEAHAGVSMVERLVGGGRRLVSGHLYRRADDYFHKGVPHQTRAAFEDPFQRLREHIAPTAHRHTEPGEVAETMPWLQLAIEADERNVEAANVAAFWLMREGHVDLAERTLLRAAAANPGDYRPLVELARVHLVRRAYDKAAFVLDRGLAKWPHPLDEENSDARYDLSWMLDFRAILHEREGRPAEALRLLERQLVLFPDRAALAAHVARLKEGIVDLGEANRRLAHLFNAADAPCDREDDHSH